ncbi:pyruvate formate lyase family protein [Agathobaculum sp. NTUH-O15-33]|uniref:pyruvate formate lyase family protein n=1 Tax=Agathobaculum sp. NTUH-O15-33 TaxID=3079302 RepID=UPI00295841BA|nr:pyruvate formate lyase family protein [Agathobaculum sp. NTUH-O15-33]WNX85487.1 pyruvate formate lyase family protein [Agathobaculum sp. NTUH-O15-33]
MTPRLEKIRTRLFEQEYHDPGTWYFKDTCIVTDENRHEPLVVRKGLATRHMGEHLPAYIRPDELIVGNPNMNSVGFGTVLPVYATEEELAEAKQYKLNANSVWGHHPPHWEKVLHIGFRGITDEIQRMLLAECSKQTPDEKSVAEYRAMLYAIEGVVHFAERHAQQALADAAQETDPKRRRELIEIHRVCSRVPYLPAETLHEAVQAYWFTYAMVNSGGEYVPLGRVDQHLYPYYRRDLENGLIDDERADDLVGSFLAKCNERICTDTKNWENHYDFGLFSQGVPLSYSTGTEESGGHESGGYDIRALQYQENESIDSDANFNFGQSGNDWLMNMIIGGVRPDGEDGTNEITFKLLRLRFEMQLLMPTLSVRVSSKAPDRLWRELALCLRHCEGEPAIYNDDAIIPGFVDIGIPLEEARDYTNDGCWETLIPGKSYFSYAHIMNLRCLEWVFTRGVTVMTGETEGVDTGALDSLTDFETFYAAYCKQVDSQIELQVNRRLENLGMSEMIAPDPLMSTIMEGCIEKGRDMTGAGILPYTFHLLLITGLSNVVDSLCAVKKLVYEDRVATLADFKKAIENNWEGCEELRLIALNRVPKYGNDNDYADDMLARVMKDFENSCVAWRAKQDKIKIPAGIGTFENYAALGRNLSASPDGRGAGEALAPNYSPTPGVDVNGPTAVIKSATRPELMRYFCGCPLDISLNANEYLGEVGVTRMEGIIRSFCDLGGQIATITATSIEELQDAVVHPEKHKDLKVRMGGLSAYFIAMSAMQQQNIIQRFAKGAVIK